MACFPLSENTYSVDQSKIFIPFNAALDNVKDRPSSLIVDICPFLITNDKVNLVIDPGLGFKQPDGNYHILNNLSAHGLTAGDISIVLLSHLHKDHFSGVVKEESNGDLALMFPNAHCYVQQGELEYALASSSTSYEKDKIAFVLKQGKFITLQGEFTIEDSIECEISGGHTPYHQVFYINNESKKYFYGGDVLPQSQQLQRKFIAKYDYDGKRSAELRIEYGKKIAAEKMIALFFHSTSTSMAALRYEADRFLIDKL